MNGGKLPEKHFKFHESLQTNHLVAVAGADDFQNCLNHLEQNETQNSDILKRQNIALQEALRKLL